LITYLRHASRAYIFSAALPPAQVAAANESFKVILDEPGGSKSCAPIPISSSTVSSRGFDTMLSTTAIVPVLCGDDETAFAVTRAAQHQDVFVLPVVSRLFRKANLGLEQRSLQPTSADEIEYAMNVIEAAGKEIGLI
jgi:glycine C-acetyltransferase